LVTYTIADDYYEVHLFAMEHPSIGSSWAAHSGVDAYLVEPEAARERLSFAEYRSPLDRALRWATAHRTSS
jgi:hypothetical protein